MKTIVGWVVASGAVFATVMWLEGQWNFFDWSPEYDWSALVDGLVAASALVGLWFLAKATRYPASRIVALLLCVALVVFAVLIVLPAEPLAPGWLGRAKPSPWWFRAGCSLLLCLPGVLWLLAVWLQSRRKDETA